MKIFNKWVGYLDRSHLTIKNSVLKKLGQTNPEMTDHSETNIMVIIVSIFSGIAEQLNYYIDNMAQEAFITTARKLDSVIKHTKFIDYRIKTSNPASADILINLEDQSGAPFTLNSDLLIPINTVFSTGSGILFISVKESKILAGESSTTVVVEQKNFIQGINLGLTIGIPNETRDIESNYVDGSMILFIGGELWELVNTLGFSGPLSKHYVVDVGIDSVAQIRFGDGINGAIPLGNQNIVADYYLTTGTRGNVDNDTINSSMFDFSVTGAARTIITNPLAATGGTNYETLEQIKISAPLSLRTLERGVTLKDYKDIAKLAPGVDKSDVKFDCNTGINLYIAPTGGGIAQTALLESTKAYVEERKIIGRPLNTQAAGESYIQLKLTVVPKPRRDKLQTREDIIDKLTEEYSYRKSDINMPIRKSDLYSLIDNLEKVDWLNIESIFTKPYIRPLNHYKQAIGTIEILETSTTTQQWVMRYVETGANDGYFEIFKNNALIGTTPMDTIWGDPYNTFRINMAPNNYQNNQSWEFTTLPYGNDQVITDNSIPIIRKEDLIINIVEQY